MDPVVFGRFVGESASPGEVRVLPSARTMLLLTVVALSVVGCRDEPAPDRAGSAPAAIRANPTGLSGQQQDLEAPGGTVSVRVPILAVEGRDFANYWCPEVLAADGQRLFRDEEGFPARFNVYWGWDDEQRLWVYNTDDGGVWVYSEGPDGWGREAWRPDGELEPPAGIQAHRVR